jgi:hypothetical protein
MIAARADELQEHGTYRSDGSYATYRLQINHGGETKITQISQINQGSERKWVLFV